MQQTGTCLLFYSIRHTPCFTTVTLTLNQTVTKEKYKTSLTSDPRLKRRGEKRRRKRVWHRHGEQVAKREKEIKWRLKDVFGRSKATRRTRRSGLNPSPARYPRVVGRKRDVNFRVQRVFLKMLSHKRRSRSRWPTWKWSTTFLHIGSKINTYIKQVMDGFMSRQGTRQVTGETTHSSTFYDIITSHPPTPRTAPSFITGSWGEEHRRHFTHSQFV